jgi:hypothetical protein
MKLGRRAVYAVQILLDLDGRGPGVACPAHVIA